MKSTQRGPIWHPFTQHALAGPMVGIASARGAWLETDDGRRILDAISSWWVITHGHCHTDIMAAIRQQTERLDQVIFAGFTHETAETLAKALLAKVPAGLSHVFFSDSGSTAVEVALKMALGYWRNIGASRTRILALEHAYHGDTVGAMSAGARGVFSRSYEPLLFDVKRIPFPSAGLEQATIDALEAACRDRSAAALIVEPLIAGAGGMLMYSAATLEEMARVCKTYDVLLIADEVMTGWGRTGTLFACEQAKVFPDIMCTAKGLTGGSMPLAATLATSAIYEAHYAHDRAMTFFHSSSYTANPIACAAAVANLQIWDREPVMQRVAGVVAQQAGQLVRFVNDKRFADVRQIGTITALDLQVRDGGYLATAGPALYQAFLDMNVLLRPLGNTIYVMPPYCMTPGELDLVYSAIDAVA